MIGGVAAMGPGGMTPEPLRLLLAASVGALGTAYGNTLNDLQDHALDRVAHPDRPLPAGQVTRIAAWNLVFLLWLAVITVGALVGPRFVLLAVALLLLLFVYERLLKRHGLIGNLAVAVASGALFPLGGLAVSPAPLQAPLVLGLVAAFAHLGRELLKDAEDIAADRGVRMSFAVRHGGHAAARLGALFTATAILASPLPHFVAGWSDVYLVAVIPADLLFAVAAVHGVKDPSLGRAIAKLAMVAALAAFVIGALA